MRPAPRSQSRKLVVVNPRSWEVSQLQLAEIAETRRRIFELHDELVEKPVEVSVEVKRGAKVEAGPHVAKIRSKLVVR